MSEVISGTCKDCRLNGLLYSGQCYSCRYFETGIEQTKSGII